MSDSPLELDLKFLPDWLKDSPSKNPYADFEGEREAPRRSGDDRRGSQGRGPQGRRPEGRGPQDRGDRRGPRPPGGASRDNRGDRKPGKGGGFGKTREGRGRWEEASPRAHSSQPEAPHVPAVKVELLPEPAAAAGIAKQIKSSARACGVFRVAKMFLDKFERFRVCVTALDPAAVIYQVGEGPLSFNRAAVESGAFRPNRERYYVVEIAQGEPPKGNYTSVARDRLSGAFLGPPNHHGYQVAMRKLYEERYSRRMSFPEFQRNIDIVSDPAAVEQWKQQACSVTTYKTKVGEGEEPVVFKTEAEVEQHFRDVHLPKLTRSGNSLEVSGAIAGALLDRSIGFTVRETVERERQVPVQMVNGLRPYFTEAGLHLFKWNRKMLFASAIRPQRHPAEQVFSEGISAILTTVGERPGIKRPELAAKILGTIAAGATEEAQQEHNTKLSALAADMHYLVQIGYVVEFQNGCLDLPPPRKDSGHADHADDQRHDVAAEAAALNEPRRTAESLPPRQREPKPSKPRRDSRYALLPLLTAASVASLA
jgi:hypothetical protein